MGYIFKKEQNRRQTDSLLMSTLANMPTMLHITNNNLSLLHNLHNFFNLLLVYYSDVFCSTTYHCQKNNRHK